MMSGQFALPKLLRENVIKLVSTIESQGSLFLLVMDQNTQDSVFKIVEKEKMLRFVASVDLIDAKKRISAHIEALYFVEVSIYNFKCILGDIQTTRYKCGRLMLVPSGDAAAMQFFNSPRFMGSQSVAKFFDDGRAVIHVAAPLAPIDSRVFLAPCIASNPISLYYNESCLGLVRQQVFLAARTLVSVMVLTGEYPLVRYLSLPEATHDASLLPQLVAAEFQAQIDEYSRLNIDYPPTSSAQRLVLIITDRTIDLFAPLLHEFTYESMAMDIEPSLSSKGKYSYLVDTEAGDVKQVECEISDEKDEYWLEMRHMHIADASSRIISIVNTLIESNPLMVDRSKATTSSDLMYIVANLKGFDEERRRIMLHRSLIDTCLSINEKSKFSEISAEFEQPCAAGGTLGDGNRVQDMADRLLHYLSNSALDLSDKLRLVLLYALYRNGIVQLDMKKLASFTASLHPESKLTINSIFANAHRAGIQCIRSTLKNAPTPTRFHSIEDEGTFNTLRFVPALSRILQQAASDQLDKKWFPYFRDQPLNYESSGTNHNDSLSNPSLSNNSGLLRNNRVKASWANPLSATGTHVGRSHGNLIIPRRKIFCYVSGGITYSEIRCVHELGKVGNRDFYLGSEALLAPRDYLKGLQGLDRAQRALDLGARSLTRSDSPPPHVYDDGRSKPVPVASSLPPVKPTVPRSLSGISINQAETKEKKKSKLRGLFK